MRGDQHSIVLVEDDRSMVVALERILKTAGYAVASFMSAEALLARGIAPDTDCLILDMSLPGIQGLELLERLRKEGVAQPAIFITARDKHETRAKAMAAKASAFLPKPFDGRDLLKAVSDALLPTNTPSSAPTPSGKTA